MLCWEVGFELRPAGVRGNALFCGLGPAARRGGARAGGSRFLRGLGVLVLHTPALVRSTETQRLPGFGVCGNTMLLCPCSDAPYQVALLV